MDLEAIEPIRQGIVIGFAVAAPVGPIGVLVIQRSMSGALVGLSTGLGAAVADAIYALSGALATAFVIRLLTVAWAFELVGAGFLAWLAWRTWTQPPKNVAQPHAQRHAQPHAQPHAHSHAHSDTEPRSVAPRSLARAFAETLLLTLANPATILSFAAVAASQGLRAAPHAATFSGGVFLGSAAWWLLLASGVRFGSRHMTTRALRTIHVASSLMLAAFAALAVMKAISDLHAG